MVGVLGPIENLEQCVRAVVEKSNIDGLDVVVNDECSLQKYIEDNGWDLPRRVRDYAIVGKSIREVIAEFERKAIPIF